MNDPELESDRVWSEPRLWDVPKAELSPQVVAELAERSSAKLLQRWVLARQLVEAAEAGVADAAFEKAIRDGRQDVDLSLQRATREVELHQARLELAVTERSMLQLAFSHDTQAG